MKIDLVLKQAIDSVYKRAAGYRKCSDILGVNKSTIYEILNDKTATLSDATATRIIANLTDDDFPGKVTKESWKSGKTDYFPVKADLTGSDQILTDGHRWLIKQYDYLDDENKNELVAVAMELVSKQLRKEAEFVRRKRSAEHELMQEVAESQADYETQKKPNHCDTTLTKK